MKKLIFNTIIFFISVIISASICYFINIFSLKENGFESTVIANLSCIMIVVVMIYFNRENDE